MNIDEQRLSAALREWTDALPVQVPERSAEVRPFAARAGGRPWAMLAVAATVVLVVAGLWMVRRPDSSPAEQPTTTVAAVPQGSALFLSQTQFRSGTVNNLMMTAYGPTIAGASADLQRWTGTEWSRVYWLPIASQGQVVRSAIPGDQSFVQVAIALDGTRLQHVELPALDPGTYRISLTDTVSAEIEICANCTPVAGPPLFDLPMRVEPVLITDSTDSVSIINDEGLSVLSPPPGALSVQRWTGEWWEESAKVTDLQQLLTLPDGAYRIWNFDVEIAGFFVQRGETPSAALPPRVELQGVMWCRGPSQEWWVTLETGEVCPLSGFGTDGSVFVPDATVSEADGAWVVTVSLWPSAVGDAFSQLVEHCFGHGELCSSGRMAVLVGGVVLSSPAVATSSFSGSIQFATVDEDSARQLAAAINATASPVAPTTSLSEDFPALTFSLLLVAPPDGYSLDWAHYDSLTDPGSHAVARYSGAPGAPMLVVLMRSAPDFFASIPADRPTWTINGRTVYNDNQGDTCDPDACSIGVQWDEQTAVSVMWVTDDGTTLGPGHDIESLLQIIEQLVPADRTDFSEGSIDWA